jgi:thiol-disulfide isomerase/thioredoxin
MAVAHLHSRAEYETALAGRPIVVVYFGATWCGPCKKYAPRYAELAARTPDVLFCKVDADECADIVAIAHVKAFPTTQIMVNGVKQKEVVGGDVGAVASSVAELRASVFTAFAGGGQSIGGCCSTTAPLSAAQARAVRLRRLGWAEEEAVAAAKAASLAQKLNPSVTPPLVAVLATIDRCAAAANGHASLTVLTKIVGNVLAHPGEAKYAAVNTSGKTYRSKVAPVKEASELLMRLGFAAETGSDGVRRLVLHTATRDGKLLAAAHAKLQRM